jgi:integrase/recombinase XerD
VPKNLYKRGGVYYARIQVSGAERRVSLKTTDRREAERRLKVFLTENSPYHGTIRRSFDDVVGDFLEEARSRLKPKTLKRYEVSALQLEAKFGRKWWDAVTKRAVVEYIDERKAEGAKIPTIRRDLTVLSQAAEWAIERGIGGVNPVAEIGKRQLRYKKPTFVRPNDQSIEATINAAYGNLKPLARFLLATGMRLDEAATLRLEAVDRARKVATLYDTKNRKSRAVALSDAALACLPESGEYAFPSRNGEPYRQASTNWQEAKVRAQKLAQKEGWRYTPVRLHDLRHIYAIDYLANGGNLYALQRQLGHSTIRQTEEYLQHLSPEEAKLAIDRSAQLSA